MAELAKYQKSGLISPVPELVIILNLDVYLLYLNWLLNLDLYLIYLNWLISYTHTYIPCTLDDQYLDKQRNKMLYLKLSKEQKPTFTVTLFKMTGQILNYYGLIF